MPVFQTGNMWSAYDDADLFVISTNAAIKRNGALVMGRGIARQARNRFPGLDTALGQQILSVCGNPSASLRPGQGQYGLIVSPRWPEARLGAFQVKQHYSQPASLELIRHSTAMLCAWCTEQPTSMVAVNFPGIGNGRLRREDVLPIVAQLPDKVTIWEYPPACKENAP